MNLYDIAAAVAACELPLRELGINISQYASYGGSADANGISIVIHKKNGEIQEFTFKTELKKIDIRIYATDIESLCKSGSPTAIRYWRNECQYLIDRLLLAGIPEDNRHIQQMKRSLYLLNCRLQDPIVQSILEAIDKEIEEERIYRSSREYGWY